MDLPVTRKEALAQGSKHYYTGVPCKYGHLDIRQSGDTKCSACNRAWQAKFSATPSGKAYHRAKNNARFPPRSKINRENLTEVELFYRDCPPGYEVDHIIPKHGKDICGFDTLSNLQYLSKSENRRKGNRVDPLTLEAVICVLPEHRSYQNACSTTGSCDLKLCQDSRTPT